MGGLRTFVSVVHAALDDLQLLVFALALDPIDQTVPNCNPPRTPALQIISQRLRLARSLEWRSSAFFDQRVKTS